MARARVEASPQSTQRAQSGIAKIAMIAKNAKIENPDEFFSTSALSAHSAVKFFNSP
jgi:hypothetical protein